MAESDYLLAALPDRHIVLGLLLRPFSLGHMMILRRLDNAFVRDGHKLTLADFDDLLEGVFICSHTYEGALEALQNPKLPKVIAKWGRKLGKFDVMEKVCAFADYIRKGVTAPEVSSDESDGRMPGAPLLQRIKIVLQSELRHSESEALNKPMGLAIHDFFAFFEMRRAINILTAEEKDDHQDLVKLTEQMKDDLQEMLRQAELSVNDKPTS